MNRFLNVCVVVLLSSIAGLAQERNIEKWSSDEKHRLAKDLIHQGSYYAAIDHLKSIVKDQPSNPVYLYRLGEAYFKSRDYVKAEEIFAKAVKLESGQKSVSLSGFRLAECLKYNGKYAQARAQFEAFLKSNYKELKRENFRTIAKMEVEQLIKSLQYSKMVNNVDVDHMGDHINSGYSDFSPTFLNDSTLVYASLQRDSVLTHYHGEHLFEHVKLFVCRKEGDQWSAPQAIQELNSSFSHSANATFSKDGKTMFFTRCKPDSKHDMICELYASSFEKGKWKSPKRLKNHLNVRGYTTTQPVFKTQLDAKGKPIEVLYFSSNRKGTLGGMDIFYATRKSDGSFSKPLNCGNQINTIRDEITPFFESNTNTLYFSSNGHAGLGGFDVFKSSGGFSKWSKPEQMGQPINSSVDDSYYTPFESDSKKALLVSNRPGGNHLLSPTCCDDIYEITVLPQKYVALTVLDSGSNSVSNASIALFRVQSLDSIRTLDTMYSIQQISGVAPQQLKEQDLSRLFPITNNEKYLLRIVAPGFDSIQYALQSDEQGQLRLDAKNTQVKIKSEKDVSYLSSTLLRSKVKTQSAELKQTQVSDSVHHEKLSFTGILNRNLADTLKGKKIKVDVRLFFDYNQVHPEVNNRQALDTLVYLMNKYAHADVTIETHTDHRGSAVYNQQLSNRRAGFISVYLMTHGIGMDRIFAQGFGEDRPIAPNTFPDGKDNPEGRRMNRRTEINLIFRDRKRTPNQR